MPQWIWMALVMLLLLSLVIQANYIKQRNRQLRYISNKLEHIRSNSTAEKLLVFTEDRTIIMLVQEISNWIEYQQQSLAAHAKLESSTRKMLSNISHDLKTPLTVVLGYLETLQLNPDLSEQERAVLLDKVQRKAMEVLELIQRFFDLAKLEAGDKHLPLTRLNMNELCRTNILEFYDLLVSHGFDVQIEIPEQTLYAMGNVEAFNRVMNNLLSNAIRYGSEGKTVGLHVSDAGQRVRIEVWDKGRGINELHADRVFERMYTLDDSRNKAFQGSGLGLTITKRLMESMNGTIQIDSKPYVRTSFILELKKIDY